MDDNYGYCIIGKGENYDPKDEETFDYYSLASPEPLHENIKEYYKNNPDEGIKIIIEPDNGDSDEEWY